MYHLGKSLQGSDYDHHLATGGTKGSAWAATGVGILSAFLILAAIFTFIFVAPEAWFIEAIE